MKERDGKDKKNNKSRIKEREGQDKIRECKDKRKPRVGKIKEQREDKINRSEG